MSLLSSKHGATVFLKTSRRHRERKILVTIFLPNSTASLLLGSQQRELDLGFLYGKVTYVT
jgi:hypothetical protein